MAKPKSTAKQSDNRVAYILLALVSVVILAAMAWMYLQYKQREDARVAYSNFGPMVVSGSGFAIRASMSVQTRTGEAEWVGQNKKQFEHALKSALLNVDPKRARALGGPQYVQQSVRDTVNTTLGSARVEDVLLTDFIIQEN